MRSRTVSALGVAVVLTILAPVPAIAQEILKLEPKFACAAEPGPTLEEATLFPSTKEAAKILSDIVAYVGLSADRIDLKASDVANAVAYLDPLSRRRLILYNEDFVRRLQNDSHSVWVPRAILAHELAHHLNNHLEIATPDRRRIEELEADRFAGHVLFKMGADLKAVTAVFAELREGGGYPSRNARTAAATNGWWVAKEQGGYPGKGSTLDVPRDTKQATEAIDPKPKPEAPPQGFQPMVEGLTLGVQQIPLAPHAGGLNGGPGVSFFVQGKVRAAIGSNIQIVIPFSFPDGRGPLFPHPQEPHYRGMGNLLVTGSPMTVMSAGVIDLATLPINPIPHYSLNLVPTGYQTSYPIAAVAHVFINGVIVGTSPATQFTVQW
jgi:hypothetical protein